MEKALAMIEANALAKKKFKLERMPINKYLQALKNIDEDL